MDKEEFENLKFSLPELIVVECPTCHELISDCDNCGLDFYPEMFPGDEVSCGLLKHICSDCYKEFDEGRKKAN